MATDMPHPIWRPFERHPGAWLSGAFAELGDRFNLPRWVFRVPALVLLTQCTDTAAVLYILLSLGLRTRLAALLPPPVARRAGFAATPPAPDQDPQAEYFTRLERRLAKIEAAVTSDELKLSRAFRDIGA